MTLQYTAVGPIEVYFPSSVETNDQLQAEFPGWDMDLISSKTGIYTRHIAAADECASDLGVKAAEKLFARHDIDRGTIDFLLFCTQTPDYPLPTTACLIQQRLNLPTSIGALDYNLGCSGFVYGLSLAEGLICSGAARRVLLITSETYSKYIHPSDRSLRTIFGDGAAATLLEASDRQSLSSFVFGTDGQEGNTLMVPKGGARPPEDALKPSNRHRWPSPMYMDGPSLMTYTLKVIPSLFEKVLSRAGIGRDEIELFLFHQATKKMLENLRDRIDLDPDRFPLALEKYGNTVSSTLPIMIHDLRLEGRLKPGVRTMLVGFGVGYSSALCLWTESWQDEKGTHT